MNRFLENILRRRGYVALSEVRELLVRLRCRMDELDEPMTREYVLNPHPGGIEHKITLMCQRRKAILARVAEEELGGLMRETAAPPAP